MPKFLRAFLALPILLAGVCHVATAQSAPSPTNFGTVTVGTGSSQTLTFTGMPSTVGFTLSSSVDFFLPNPAPSCTGGSCSLQATFKPSFSGFRTGAVIAFDQNSKAILASAFMYGIGASPSISIGPGVLSTIASRTSASLPALVAAGVAVSAGGGVWLSDSASNTVQFVNPQTGTVTAIAGNGNRGNGGDGGSGTSASLNSPSGLAVDGVGNLYIADTGNNSIREVNGITGVINTFPGTAGQLSGPMAVTVDGQGNLFIADTNNNRVVEVTPGGTLTVIATGLNQPQGVALDANGNVFIADTGNHVVKEVVSGTATVVAGIAGSAGYSGDGGAATSGQLNGPTGVAVDAGGSIYIAEKGNMIVRKVTGDASHTLSTIAGIQGQATYTGDGGSATTGTIGTPVALTLDASFNIFLADSTNNTIRKVSALATSVNFPYTAVGNVSPSMTVTISNTGNQPLSISGFGSSPNFQQQAGTTCSSTVAAGASCAIVMTFVSTAGGATVGTLTVPNNALNQSIQSSVTLVDSTGSRFVPITPCRLVDTRNANGPLGGPSLTAAGTRSFTLQGTCGIPTDGSVLAYSLNATVVPPGVLGFLAIWPTGQNQPVVSTLNSDGRVKANAIIVPAGAPNGAISVFSSHQTDFVLDINGYFVGPTASTYSGALAFYPLPPCRVVDTRVGSGSFGGPFMAGNSTRDFPIQSSSCNVPNSAQAYSLNFTAVPRAVIGFLSTWPAGQNRPLVSTLNASSTATAIANAAIVPAGNNGGSISVFTSGSTDLVIDINGYFAPPTTGGLALYNITPCRVVDTRGAGGIPPSSGPFSPINVVTSSCSVPNFGQAYVLNATVVPTTSLGYLAMWPSGGATPFQSTLNASDEAVTSNMAILPTANGFVSVFASSATYLVLDINAYFAP